MNRFTQFIIGLNSFLTLLLVTAVLLSIFDVYSVMLQIELWPNTAELFWVLIGILSFIALVNLILFFSSFRMGGPPRSRGQLDVRTQNGTLSISQQTIDSTIYRSVKRFEGIRAITIRSRIHSEEESLEIAISFSVIGNEPVQQLASKVQRAVKEDVEHFLEVAVSTVQVNIKEPEPDNSQKQRVV
ncbi:alkaline shock response membrane anchor protein AmaP [Geomicrobium sp. JCM 19055]|uniref:alkaline shock response membrane anchor protein AmaP n=1 Tax=Geomicrobium sp. JCM 19055 TaxID=1460649 RepID=UPI0005A5D506|nr:alkaline shock response membrane anchor protein AmaP [Geomicrobium sp. JCM 19055]